MVPTENIRAFILDMDGVIYLGKTPRPGSADFLARLRQSETPFLFLTNNTVRTSEQYVALLDEIGLDPQAVPEQFITSAQVTALWLRRNLPPESSVFVIGESALRTVLARKGFVLVGSDAAQVDAVEIDAVVVSMDHAFDYEKLKSAALAIRGGALFVGTNPDVTHPTPRGLFPGTGSILAAVEAASGAPPLVMGKPHSPAFEEALRRLGHPAANTIMIGDRLETDIAGGKEAGLLTGLVLGGASSKDDLAQSPIKPDFLFRDMEHLGRWFRRR